MSPQCGRFRGRLWCYELSRQGFGSVPGKPPWFTKMNIPKQYIGRRNTIGGINLSSWRDYYWCWCCLILSFSLCPRRQPLLFLMMFCCCTKNRERERERESCTDTTEFIVGQIFALPQPMRDEVKPKTEEPWHWPERHFFLKQFCYLKLFFLSSAVSWAT